MKPLEICRSIRSCWDALFLPRLVTHLETENAALRAKVVWLEQRISAAHIPWANIPGGPSAADFSKIPQSVGGTAGFWDADARKRTRLELWPEEKKTEEKPANANE